MVPESNQLKDYLVSDSVVDWKNPVILDKANKLTTGLSDDSEKAKHLFEWVRDKIPHSKDIDSDVVSCSASEVLDEGTGICAAKSHLLAALCRAVKIPTGFCYQKLKKEPPFTGFILHGLNGIYLSTFQKWIRVDARGNTGNINAQFGIDQEQLAFTTNTSNGEILYDQIFISPIPEYIKILTKYHNRKKMWPFLPTELPN
jgi:transglutaminase-like putative cysteine protease